MELDDSAGVLDVIEERALVDHVAVAAKRMVQVIPPESEKEIEPNGGG